MLCIITIAQDKREKVGGGQAKCIAPDNALISTKTAVVFILFRTENICCGYSLEAPQ